MQEDFIKEMVDTKEKGINFVVNLVVNTVKAKYLYSKGGWKLCRKELGDCGVKYENPNFSIFEMGIYNWARRNDINLGINVSQNMGEIVNRVNKNLGVNAVELGDRRITIIL